MSAMVRTRFAPSPTGYLHLGGARTALFAWAYARRHQGRFILRIEDTDLARSTPEATQAILDAMHWLGLDYDEGPFYQSERFDRYRQVIAELLAAGKAYRCYLSPDELEALRERQRAHGEKPRYDGRWRPETGKVLPEPPAGVSPVIRFKGPTSGEIVWDDAVKGRIRIACDELDDLIIARADGTPTYNFCVVVDDMDMRISDVIRGDDHVNNTPRQIAILEALGASLPRYAHVSMILGDDGQKLSKRHGAVSVIDYAEEGILAEAMLNCLARLGWSHGNQEIFSRDEIVQFFDLDHITAAAAQFDRKKLRALNQHYLNTLDHVSLIQRLVAWRQRKWMGPTTPTDIDRDALRLAALFAPRCHDLAELQAALDNAFAEPPQPDEAEISSARPALKALTERLIALAADDWQSESLGAALKATLAEHRLKMPQLAIPLRLVLLGCKESPSIDAVMAALGRERCLTRLGALNGNP